VLLKNVLLIVLFGFLHGCHSSIWAKHIPQSICSKYEAAVTPNFHCNDTDIWLWRHYKLI